MTKLLTALFLSIGISAPAIANDYWTGGLIGGAIGYVLGKSADPDVVVVQHGYPQVWIPLQPRMTSPRVYPLPPSTDPRFQTPIWEERLQFEPSCNCYIKIYNQIGWQ